MKARTSWHYCHECGQNTAARPGLLDQRRRFLSHLDRAHERCDGSGRLAGR